MQCSKLPSLKLYNKKLTLRWNTQKSYSPNTKQKKIFNRALGFHGELGAIELFLPNLANTQIQNLAEIIQNQSFSDILYIIGQNMNNIVLQQLVEITPLTFLIVLLSGLATSLSPCTLSVLPLTIGYIGSIKDDISADKQGNSILPKVSAFSLGLITTLSGLGFAASALGKAYGQIGNELPIFVSVIAILMGLNLLEVLPISLPSLDVDVRKYGISPSLQAYLAGVTFAFAASPCSTPVLITLLAYVSSTENPLSGGLLLTAYTTGYIAPLILAATATGTLSQLMSMRQASLWITPASGALLLAGGTYALLSRLFPS